MKNKKTTKHTRSALIKLFEEAGYDTEGMTNAKEWPMVELVASAKEAKLIGTVKRESKIKAAAKRVRQVFAETVKGLTLSEMCKQIADNTINLTKWQDVGPAILHKRDDMAIGPDLDLCWQPQVKLAEAKEIASEICSAMPKLKKLSRIPARATELDMAKVPKGKGFEGPYYTDGKFVFRDYKGSGLIVASPVSVWKKHLEAKI